MNDRSILYVIPRGWEFHDDTQNPSLYIPDEWWRNRDPQDWKLGSVVHGQIRTIRFHVASIHITGLRVLE